jgi:OPA family glycerol-3-phosphate transporter-like MFS transporter 1/2
MDAHARIKFSFLFPNVQYFHCSGYIAEHMDIRFFLTGGMILSGTFSILFGLGYFLKIHSLAFFIIVQVR